VLFVFGKPDSIIVTFVQLDIGLRKETEKALALDLSEMPTFFLVHFVNIYQASFAR